MLKQTGKSTQLISKEIQQDIQFLLSNIRARQNGLIFFLQRFSSECKNNQQYVSYKQQFLQKQKIYANQVNRVIKKFTEDKQNQQEIKQFIRTFWIKVKSIIKVSLDRLRMLKLLNQKIFIRYEEIINIINQSYDQEKNLEQFSQVENLLKKRNVDALIYSRNQFSEPSSETKIGKNRSESAFKQSKFSPKPQKFVEQSFGNEENNNIFGVSKLIFDQNKKDPQQRMKSLNGYRRNKILMQNKEISSKFVQKNYKKILKNIEKTQKCLEGAMDCIIQFPIDKKKSYKQNEDAIYDDLFNKNIPNHKMISKFLFGACGIAQLLVKRKNLKVKKIFITSKIERNNRESKDFDKVNKTKPAKQIRQKQKKQKDFQNDKDREKNKQKIKDKERQKQKEKQKQKQKNKQKSKQRPQSSLTSQIRGIFQQEKRRMIQTTLILQDKRSNKYKRRIGHKIQKYTKLVKLIS